jgi:hypothetical protein
MSEDNKAAWNQNEDISIKVARLRDKSSALVLKGKYRDAYFYIREEKFLIFPHLEKKELDRLEIIERKINQTILQLDRFKVDDSEDDDEFEYTNKRKKRLEIKKFRELANRMRLLVSEDRHSYRNLVYKLGDSYGYGMGRKDDDDSGFD